MVGTMLWDYMVHRTIMVPTALYASVSYLVLICQGVYCEPNGMSHKNHNRLLDLVNIFVLHWIVNYYSVLLYAPPTSYQLISYIVLSVSISVCYPVVNDILT